MTESEVLHMVIVALESQRMVARGRDDDGVPITAADRTMTDAMAAEAIRAVKARLAEIQKPDAEDA